jgi:hypothetical protein
LGLKSVVPVVLVVGGVVVARSSALFGLAFIMPFGEALIDPWVFIWAPALAPAPPPGPPP